jgi:hypothetical protein
MKRQQAVRGCPVACMRGHACQPSSTSWFADVHRQVDPLFHCQFLCERAAAFPSDFIRHVIGVQIVMRRLHVQGLNNGSTTPSGIGSLLFISIA